VKITAVDVFILKTPLEEPFAFSQGWVKQRAATLVRISTEDNISGWGEAFCQGLEPPEISAAVIQHALTPLILGADPLQRSVLWHSMYVNTRDYGRKGSVVAAISAIDTALWDLAGKISQQSVSSLLGGEFRKSVRPYATGFYRISGQGESQRLADEALQHRDNGFGSMKIKLGFGVTDDIQVMQAIASALGDNSIELMVDTNHAYGRTDALRLGKALEPFNLRWYEEPVVPEDIEGYCELRAQLNIPIAGGENEHTAFGFEELFRRRAIDVAQPDIGSCGGLTAARDIAAMAQAAGIAVNPHVWGTAVAQAASLQLIASLPVAHPGLFATEPVLEYDQSAHPFRQDLISNPWAMRDRMIGIPDGPGLGIELRMDTVDKYRTNVDSQV